MEAYDDLSTGRLANIKQLMGHDRFRFTKAGKDSHLDIIRGVLEADVTFHLASRVGVERVKKNPRDTLKQITSLSQFVFQAASYARRKVFYASSSEAGEITCPESPRSSYGLAKAYCEALGFAYHKEGAFPFTVARFFNVAGPRQSTDYVLPRFVRQALRGDKLTVNGDGSQVRCFCHVAEAVGAILLMATNDKANGQRLDIGRCEPVCILNLAQEVIKATGSDSKIVPDEQVDLSDVRMRAPETHSARRLLGWEARRGLDNIIQDTVESFKGEGER